MKLRLFKVTYREWNHTFSGKNWREMLAVGRDAEDAISRARKEADKDATDFEAWEITNIMGYKIAVGEKVLQKKANKKKNSFIIEYSRVRKPSDFCISLQSIDGLPQGRPFFMSGRRCGKWQNF